jgi:hypothetical protein
VALVRTLERCWRHQLATTIGLVAYYAGQSATGTIALFGVAGLASTLGLSGVLLARQQRRRRHQAPGRPAGD